MVSVGDHVSKALVSILRRGDKCARSESVEVRIQLTEPVVKTPEIDTTRRPDLVDASLFAAKRDKNK